MAKQPKRKGLKGFFCETCRGFRLTTVADTTKPCNGVVRRYRRCVVCCSSIVTEERVVRHLASAAAE